MTYFVLSRTQNLGAVKFLIAEHSEVSKTRHLTVKFLSAEFAAVSELSDEKFNGPLVSSIPDPNPKPDPTCTINCNLFRYLCWIFACLDME